MKVYLFILMLLLSFWLISCSKETEAPQNDINVEVLSPIFPPVVGSDELVLRVTHTETGEPISNAYLSVKGDMIHDGMVPVLSSVKTGADGEYAVPFEWTMGGDWILTVNVAMPDGLMVEKAFDLVVDGDEVTCAPIEEE